mgnify:CR=1 FL=1
MSRETAHPVRDPLALFELAFADALGREPVDATAVTLATVDAEGFPDARVVLLKGVDRRGFIFYTNYASHKGRQLDGSGRAALCFLWPQGLEQVRVRGAVSRVSGEESDAYFASRPRGSQIGAWASRQSEVLGDRAELERRVAELEEQYRGTSVPRPDHWGGYLLTPLAVEFWYGRESRLHDRHLYLRGSPSEPWSHQRLSP